ncbi:MAG: NUDIX hydrolase [bacterium]|nr:NUDIX hydrolase [bacterium]
MEQTKVGSVSPELLDGEYLNDAGTDMLLALLTKLRPGRWGRAFIPLRSLMVTVACELVIVERRQVLLTYREDKHFKGWHTPGTYIEPGEDLQTTAQRCATRELGEKVRVRFKGIIGAVNHPKSARFHDLSVLALCEIVEGSPTTGAWFSECPKDLIPDHLEYWPMIEKVL